MDLSQWDGGLKLPLKHFARLNDLCIRYLVFGGGELLNNP
jgi:hypothetical protein